MFETTFMLPTANPAIPPVKLCPGTVPLVLLPVRLETRFFTLDNNVTELRIRIYPDSLHVDTHEPELTTDERTFGTAYWQQDWTAGNDLKRRSDAWRTLASHFGAPRAAWIARVLTPTNLAQRPTTPVPPGQSPAVPPLFPTLPPVGVGGESTWRHAPQARLLPDRWIAIVHSAGQVALTATGKDISKPLAVGPDPQAPPPDAQTEAAIRAGDRLAVDPDMLWMVDFAAAEAVGMGLRITLPPATLAAGLDSLLVFGIASSQTVPATAVQLADLLDAHHYTDGLEFLRYGTPTNNTDDRRAGYSSDDPGQARSFQTEVIANPASAPNAARVGRALGLPAARSAATLGHLGQATQDHETEMRSMNAALWQVGWGYFLTNMVGAETGLSMASVDWARTHFVNYVRCGGPFPAIRCGKQPYGVLPVTSLDLWAPGASEGIAPQEIWLRDMLLKLRDRVWRPVASKVARIGVRQADPDADLADVMRTDAVSSRVMTRTVVGRHYLEHLYSLAAQDFGGIAQTQDIVAARLIQLLNLPAPHLAHTFLTDSTLPITAPLVQSGEVSPWQLLQPNFIAAFFAERHVQALIAIRPTSLLQALLRHALLREIATAAARIAATLPGNDLGTLLRDLELVDLVDAPPTDHTLQAPPLTLHWQRQLDLNVPSITGTSTIRQFLETVATFTTPQVAALGEVRTSLSVLQRLDTEDLQYLMLGTLDLSAHRLDAWATSFATKRLALMTRGGPIGQLVGGYGWVENLRPGPPQPVVPAASMPPGEQAPLCAPTSDTGFIHAPSTTHAATAALLRNAHLGPSGLPDPNGPFAIDLSSRRVREATRLLEGVRAGQPVGALLGYEFERRLHDLKLDPFIAPLRELAPLVVRQHEASNWPAESVAANNVVDGLVLVRRVEDPTDVAAQAVLQAIPNPQQGLVANELRALRDAIDGLSDALLAEVAHQMARGNAVRMATTLSAVGQGEALPSELEVAHIPRSGNSITHRVLVLMSGGAQAAAGWFAPATSILATTEPMLNGWASGLLGDPRKIRCTVEQLDDASGAVVGTAAFPLSELPLTPLDVVYSVEPTGGATVSSQALTTLEQLVLYQARRRAGGFGAARTLRLQHARPANLSPGEITLFDVLEQARAIGRSLENARGVRPDDLSVPGRASQSALDLADLEHRMVQAEQGLNAAQTQLTNVLAQADAAPAEDLRRAMLAVGAYGIGPAVPNASVGDSPEIHAVLTRQAAALLNVSSSRLDLAARLRTPAAASDPRVRCEQLLERAHAIFGARFVVLPRFTCDAATAAELNTALSASTQQQAGDPLAVHGWFIRSARVRDPLARLAACMRGAEVLGTGDRLSLRVAQLPYLQTERWVGLPPLPGTDLAQSKLSAVVQSSVPIDASLPLSGVFVDEWVELIPSDTETTALAFQLNPPDSFAPHNILIAVPPVPGQDWTTETLRRVLMETLDLARLRAVDPSLLGSAAQYLPGLYLPFNAADAAVSTDFAPLTS